MGVLWRGQKETKKRLASKDDGFLLSSTFSPKSSHVVEIDLVDKILSRSSRSFRRRDEIFRRIAHVYVTLKIRKFERKTPREFHSFKARIRARIRYDKFAVDRSLTGIKWRTNAVVFLMVHLTRWRDGTSRDGTIMK